MELQLRFVGKLGEDSPPYPVGQLFVAPIDKVLGVTIGRIPDVDLRLDDISVGRQVVRVTRREHEFWVEDLHSGGGSFLLRGGTRIDRPHCALAPGDQLGVGRLVFEVAVVS